MTESRQPYIFKGDTFDAELREWVESIPQEFRHPADDSPRARILDAAAQHFAAEGFSASTTRAIAASAGVNQAMIHYYFQTKTRLYERVLAGIVVDLLTSLAESLRPRSHSPVDALVSLPERILGEFASDPIRVQIFRREIGDGAPHARAVIEQLGASGPRGFRRIMLAYIEAARRAGALASGPDSAPPPSTLAFLLIHAYGALLIEPMMRHVFSSDDPRESIESILESQRTLVRRALTDRPKEDETT